MAVPTGRGVAQRTWQTVGAASIGNALEWFDLLIDGYLAVTIFRVFFPSNHETVSLLLALSMFGATYLIRPLGALGQWRGKARRQCSLPRSGPQSPLH